MNPNAYRGYQFVKAWEESLINGDSTIEPVGILSGDFDTPATIIEAVRAWQEANTLREKHAHDWDDSYSEAERGAAYELWAAAFKNMVALRLPPVEEAKSHVHSWGPELPYPPDYSHVGRHCKECGDWDFESEDNNV